MAIANLAHLLLPCGQANASAKSKELNSIRTKQNGACRRASAFAHLAPFSFTN
jgi:hypothetical protein